jgi:hypothetical protein
MPIAKGGSGLGLWISKRIVRMHEVAVNPIEDCVEYDSCVLNCMFQGYMGFHSEGAGHGATFFFELPVYSAPPTGSQPIAAQSSLKGKLSLPLLSSSLTSAESSSIDTLSSPNSPSSTLCRTKNRPASRTSANSLSDITYIEEGWFSHSRPIISY